MAQVIKAGPMKIKNYFKEEEKEEKK